MSAKEVMSICGIQRNPGIHMNDFSDTSTFLSANTPSKAVYDVNYLHRFNRRFAVSEIEHKPTAHSCKLRQMYPLVDLLLSYLNFLTKRFCVRNDHVPFFAERRSIVILSKV